MKVTRKTSYRLRTLDFYAGPYLELYERLNTNTTARLRYIVKCCGEPTSTNCGWHIYQAAPLIKKLSEDILARRAVAARKRGPS